MKLLKISYIRLEYPASILNIPLEAANYLTFLSISAIKAVFSVLYFYFSMRFCYRFIYVGY